MSNFVINPYIIASSDTEIYSVLGYNSARDFRSCDEETTTNSMYGMKNTSGSATSGNLTSASVQLKKENTLTGTIHCRLVNMGASYGAYIEQATETLTDSDFAENDTWYEFSFTFSGSNKVNNNYAVVWEYDGDFLDIRFNTGAGSTEGTWSDMYAEASCPNTPVYYTGLSSRG